MKKILLTLTALALTFGQAALAASTPNLDLYHRLIDAQRDSTGKLIQLVLKPAAAVKSNGLSELGQDSVDITVALQDRLDKMNVSPRLTVENIQTLTQANWTKDDIKNYQDAKTILSTSQDVQRVLSNKIVDDILREFQKDLNLIFQFNVLAKPGVPGYFHDRALIDKALKKALSAAENALGAAPALRAVEFLLNLALNWVEEKRSYTQNILLFYMEKASPSDLGFTAQEVSFIKSSIYERQIAWWDFQKLEIVKKHWSTYGAEKFSNQIVNNSGRLEKYGAPHGEILPSLNFAFTPIAQNDLGFIFNTQDPKSKTSKDLSLAFDPKSPQHIRDFRIELQLTQLASSLLPIPGFVLGQLNGLIGSYYSNQKLTEGALYAYLVSEGKAAEALIVLRQSINPFLIHDFE